MACSDDIPRRSAFEREVDLHDCVFLDDADEHDHADKGVDVQIDPEER